MNFRDSKLTYILKDCLSGNSRTLMFVNVGPAMVRAVSLCFHSATEAALPALTLKLTRPHPFVCPSPRHLSPQPLHVPCTSPVFIIVRSCALRPIQSNVPETINSLNFALRAKKVELGTSLAIRLAPCQCAAGLRPRSHPSPSVPSTGKASKNMERVQAAARSVVRR